MRLKATICSVIVCLLLTTILRANSVFSFDGFPNQDYNYNVYGMGMGETGIGDTNRRNTGFINPSLMTTLNQVYFSTGISGGLFYYLDNDQRFRTEGINFPYFNFTVPLSNHRLGFNYSQYLSGNVDVHRIDKEWEGLKFTEINKVRSSIYKGSFLYGYKSPIINMGVSFDYHLGHHVQEWEQKYREAGQFINPWYQTRERYRNYGFSAGLNRSFEKFSFGAFYRSAIDLKGSSQLKSVMDADIDLGDVHLETPHHLGAGIVWRMNNLFRIATDMHYELWSQTNYYRDPQDTYKLSLGFAYDPQWGYDKWYQKIPLRAGGYYRTLPFKAEDNYLDEQAITFGFTIPLQTPNSQLDFSLKYLIRGTTDKNGYQDENLIFSIGFSGFDFFRSRQKKIAHRDIPEAEFESFR